MRLKPIKIQPTAKQHARESSDLVGVGMPVRKFRDVAEMEGNT